MVAPRPIRSRGLPATIGAPYSVYRDASILKNDEDYAYSKSGDGAAAARLIIRHAPPLIPILNGFAARYPKLIVVSPHAEEATGDNAIPQVFGSFIAAGKGFALDRTIVQANRAFHTGADPMQRLIARPLFDGAVEAGATYVLADDVSTLGGTLAELGHFIQAGGGIVVGAVLLVNASRSGHLLPEPRILRLLEQRFGEGFVELFGIAIDALTRDEAQYLVGFRSVDELRTRAA